MTRITNLALMGSLISLSFVLAGCLMDPPEPGESEALGTDTNQVSNLVEPEPVGTNTPHVRDEVKDCTFTARLSGNQEVPPVMTDATGKARFRLDTSGTEPKLIFKLSVFDIENVLFAHIHLGAKGENGPIVAFLFDPKKPVDPPDGVLNEGTIRASDLVGPLDGKSLLDLAREMAEGNTYVNVHTEQNPGGEIRGQIKLISKCNLQKPCEVPAPTPTPPPTEIPK